MSHIAFLIPGLDKIAGAERQVMLLSRGLKGRGWRITVIVLSGSGGDAAVELADHGVAFLFLGYQPDLLPWMNAADAFVLSSLWEGLPVALLEAGACALPAVATSVAGTCDAIIDGETVLLVQPRSPEALAYAMHTLMRMPLPARQSIGERARKHVVTCFSLEKTLNRWEALYATFGATSSSFASVFASSQTPHTSTHSRSDALPDTLSSLAPPT